MRPEVLLLFFYNAESWTGIAQYFILSLSYLARTSCILLGCVPRFGAGVLEF